MSALMPPRFEWGDTRQFTVAYSLAPSTPNIAIYCGSGSTTVAYSATAQSSDSTHFYAFFTMPQSTGIYVVQWTASYNAGAVLTRDWFKVVRTTAT